VIKRRKTPNLKFEEAFPTNIILSDAVMCRLNLWGIVKYMIAKTQQAAQAPAEWVTQVGQVTGAVSLQSLVACKLCLIRPGVSSGMRFENISNDLKCILFEKYGFLFQKSPIHMYQYETPVPCESAIQRLQEGPTERKTAPETTGSTTRRL
jgi:hypothetical protein